MDLKVSRSHTYMSREMPSNGKKDIDKEVYTDTEAEKDRQRWD